MKKIISLMLVLAMVAMLAACNSADPKESKPEGTPGASGIQNPQGSEPQESQPTQTGSDKDPGSSQGGTQTPPETTQPQVLEPGYTFTYGTTKITMNDDVAPILAALGDSKSYTEEASCAFEGVHKTYYFGGFYLQTYPDGETDRVYLLWLVDDTVTTEEGLYIGAPKSLVDSLYGGLAREEGGAYYIDKGMCTLMIIMENDVVTSIQYMANVQ